MALQHRFFRYRFALLLNLLFLIPAGYWVRFYHGGRAYWNDLLGAIAYEVFWILLFLLFYPKTAIGRVAIGVCLVTCMLEFLQLWHPPLLEAMRATLPGRLVLGNTFSWSDFFSYFLGSFIGWIWAKGLVRLTRQPS